MTAGRYTFEEKIGRGASGPVWRGRDTVLGRSVALKRVDTHSNDIALEGEVVAREARLAAALSHPNVVGVFDLFRSGDQDWLVMEYVEGPTLAQLVRERGPIPGPEAAALLCQVAEALDAAHRAGIVHRDVKPSNILLTPGGAAKLTDFGIARGAEDESLTLTGQVTGSPAYIAPEVATGAAATPASDVWSLGATLYQLVAGHPPYDVGDSVLSTMYRIVHEAPPRLPELGRLNHLLERTMAVDPSQRWTMAQVQTALDHLAHEPGTTMPIEGPVTSRRIRSDTHDPSPTRSSEAAAAPGADRTSAKSRRGRWALGAAIVVMAAGLALVTFDAGLTSGDRGEGTGLSAPPVNSSDAEGEVAQTEASAEQMESFVNDYLSTVTNKPRAAWRRLTPDFQQQSDGYRSYAGYWDTVASADVTQVRADPTTMRVTYSVDYEMRDGTRTSDTVTLTLTSSKGSLLIAGEA